ncbi:aspartyl aminopeptidase [[Candida] zeylanoides]
MSSQALECAQDFVDYVNASPTPYHAVKNVKTMLSKAGFIELMEAAKWPNLARSDKYFVTRNASSLIAFTIGAKYEAGDGVSIVGAHTDSPCLRLKPVSKKTSEGFIQIGVEQYGGLIAHSWFDRDLSIAGRVYVTDSNGYSVPKLIKIDKPLLRIPTLAIHLDRTVKEKFTFNSETKLVPIAGQVALDKHESHMTGTCADDPELQMSSEQFQSVQSVITRHSYTLVSLIASECDVAPQDIEDFELVLFDHQKSTIGGLNDDFIFSPRLDNLTSCFCATKGLIESTATLDQQRTIQLISLFDHEEIGSVSAQGADSTFLPDVLKRLVSNLSTSDRNDSFHQVMANSFLLSSDMAHGVHPNYGEVYEAQNRPHINKGPVIKINANQRYATNSPGIVLIKKCATLAEVPLQLFVVRNDSPCGSTIGPILSAKLGIRTLDLGNPQLSMHSIRETGGTFDVIRLCNLFTSFFENYHAVNSKIHCDGY